MAGIQAKAELERHPPQCIDAGCRTRCRQAFAALFDCITWDGNSRLKPIQGDDSTDTNPTIQKAGVEHLLALLFPALRVELGLLRSMRQLLPAGQFDVGHEVEVWNHAAVNRAGDEWGWQAGSREQYRQTFIKQFEKLFRKIKHKCQK